ncbi:MAG: hypothetical protein KatS3mg105_0928 [Gemmatales bacterium]|nr:MAG: hypothetical protein KatS3mg105_0928 [Gemmatales bacterium]
MPFALAIWFVASIGAAGLAASPVPLRGPAPLLYVRFVTPPRVHVTFFPGGRSRREFPAPVQVGLRPGYIYRIMLAGLPERPELLLYPTIEVRGTLHLPKFIKTADHPAPIIFREEDIRAAFEGKMITKVIYLEDPEQAVARDSSTTPLEFDIPPGSDALAEAADRGRPLLVVRLGERQLSDEELSSCGIPGTILFPGEKFLRPPAAPPCLPWACLPFVDPFWGVKPPTEECLHDGGDTGLRAGLDRNGQIGGLDPSDSMAVYADSRGTRRLAISNRVCVCVPRFITLRSQMGTTGYDVAWGVGTTHHVQPREQLLSRHPPLVTNQQESLKMLQSRQRASGAIATTPVHRIDRLVLLQASHIEVGPADTVGTTLWQRLRGEVKSELVERMRFARQFENVAGVRGLEKLQLGPAAVGQIQGVNVVGIVQETRSLTSTPHGLPTEPDQPLHLYKWADRQSAQVGDEITFYLKYSNQGGQPISNVAVTDSLTSRLEYVSGSAKTDRDAVFTVRPNQAGSVILQWEISGLLLPGQSGIVSFRARVR